MWRRHAGVGLTLLIMAGLGAVFFAKVYAADAPMKAADVINPINTAWTLIAAFLVYGMQVGFTIVLKRQTSEENMTAKKNPNKQRRTFFWRRNPVPVSNRERPANQSS